MSYIHSKRQKAELEHCKKTLIIVWKTPSPPTIDKVFYTWCRRTNNPYVRICKRRKYANISMDLPNVSGFLDVEGSNQLRILCLNYGFPEEGNSFRNASVEDFPIKDAGGYAQKLVQIGLDFCRRNPPFVQND
ncbi:MAG: hypothetical protein ABIQ35_12285 [Verrucomicrobiota bacterium]